MAEFKKDNEILVEFDFVIDLDLAIYKFIKFKGSAGPLDEI